MIIGSSGNFNVEQELRSLGLMENIELLPAVNDIRKEFSKSSINLLTSRYEGFGLVIIEAAAIGVPTIAFDCPVGPKDIITNGVDGILVEDGNINAFADTVITLVKDEELRKNMGANAKIMSGKYAIEPIMREWDELFRSLKRT